MPIISLTSREKESVSPICSQAKDKAPKPNGIAKYPVGNGNGRLSVIIILLKLVPYKITHKCTNIDVDLSQRLE